MYAASTLVESINYGYRVYDYGTELFVGNCTFVDNVAGGSGGGVAITDAIVTVSKLTTITRHTCVRDHDCDVVRSSTAHRLSTTAHTLTVGVLLPRTAPGRWFSASTTPSPSTQLMSGLVHTSPRYPTV